eukprot:TRINITY_DN6937_c0_g2_i3.p1 TRINITY_DN6937_c0_g2~~TRINITY_DN6937_c0_g2_i3.p1  ORF type:complete len:417 (+),score=125.33 TRINITY_DN6937_c0_g2_i3:29-1279(+)
MGELGNVSDLEVELIQRNREIAKTRDEVIKGQKRISELQMRNDDLLEKVAELDGEVTKKSVLMEEIQGKARDLEQRLASKEEEVQSMREEMRVAEAKAREEMAAREAAWKEESSATAELKTRIVELEAARAELQQEVEDARQQHAESKAALERTEARETIASSEAAEFRRKIRKLEEQVADMEAVNAKMSEEKVRELEEARVRAEAEISHLNSKIEESSATRRDTEEQSRHQVTALERKVEDLSAQVAESKRELSESAGKLVSVEIARDEAVRAYEELKNTHQEQVDRAETQAASLEGSLNSQRLLFQETSEALARSEETEARLTKELAAKMQEVTSEQAIAKSESENLQVRLDKALADSSKAQTEHVRSLDSLRSQNAELRGQVADWQGKAEELDRQLARSQDEVKVHVATCRCV